MGLIVCLVGRAGHLIRMRFESQIIRIGFGWIFESAKRAKSGFSVRQGPKWPKMNYQRNFSLLCITVGREFPHRLTSGIRKNEEAWCDMLGVRFSAAISGKFQFPPDSIRFGKIIRIWLELELDRYIGRPIYRPDFGDFRYIGIGQLRRYISANH